METLFDDNLGETGKLCVYFVVEIWVTSRY